MEDLINIIDKSCSISSQDNLNRKSQFKFIGRAESARDKRRAQLLDHYKEKRKDLFNEKRGLLDNEFVNEDPEWMDWEEKKRSKKPWIYKDCKEQLMLSEWLLDRPYDLNMNWTCVVCPEGQRTLVIAKRGCTRAFHKSGYLLAKFKSILPNGAPNSRSGNINCVILDCIWKKSTRQLFALDVLYWKQSLLDCDAQFRLYWLKSRLTELRQSVSVQKGMYDVFLPAHCQLSTLASTLSEHDPSLVDGVLFYHNSAPYISGQTPLVGWLKPYMLQERFGLEISQEYLALKPDEYKDLEQWVATVSHSHSRRHQSNSHKQEMEVDRSGTQTSGSSDASMCEDNSGN